MIRVFIGRIAPRPLSVDSVECVEYVVVGQVRGHTWVRWAEGEPATMTRVKKTKMIGGKVLDPYRGRDPRDIPAYTTFEAARYLRVPERTLFDWSFGRSYRRSDGAARHMPPLIKVADRERHVLSFTNLAELHVLDALRRSHNVQLKKIRQTILYLGREFNAEHPLVHQEMFTDGLNVFIDHYGELSMRLKRVSWRCGR